MKTVKTERYLIEGARRGDQITMLDYRTFEEACEALNSYIDLCKREHRYYKRSNYIITLERIETIYDDDDFIIERNSRKVTISTVKNV